MVRSESVNFRLVGKNEAGSPFHQSRGPLARISCHQENQIVSGGSNHTTLLLATEVGVDIPATMVELLRDE